MTMGEQCIKGEKRVNRINVSVGEGGEHADDKISKQGEHAVDFYPYHQGLN
jgi:hypothetical protein